MTMQTYSPNQADGTIMATIPAACDPVTIFHDAIRCPQSVKVDIAPKFALKFGL
jgi:hypothetical protein